jgi:hypothetical protein
MMMNGRCVGAAVAALLLVGGCASPQGAGPASPATSGPAAPSAAFRVADFAWSKAPGKGQIDGQLSYSPRGVAYGCANGPVVLTPETAWVRSRMMILYQSADAATLPAADVRARTPPERSQDYSQFARRATCDAANHFTFAGLPDGAWFVITVAKPTKPGPAQEMAIMRRVTIRNGETIRPRLP